MKNNIEIAQAATLRPISALAADRLGIPEEALEPYGRHKAKLSLSYINSLADRPDGKLVLVTAISPTPAAGWASSARLSAPRQPGPALPQSQG